jgi:membrane protease YdiL (CAAX protease family)
MRQPTKSAPWVFLALWVVTQAAGGIGLGAWSMSHPGVREWIYKPQGFFFLSLLGLLLGVGIIVVMQRPRSALEMRELFSVAHPLKQVRFHWFLLGIAIAMLTTVFPRTWGGSRILGDISRRAHSQGGLAYIAAAMILGPIPEEAIFRGFVYRSFSASYGRLGGTIITALLNAVFHRDSIRGSVFAACFFTGMGALLCYIFDSRRNLSDCILFHIAYNGALVVWMVAGS